MMDRVFVKLTPDMPVSQAVSILLKKNLTGAPVVNEDGRLMGILSEKDCLKTLMIYAYDQMPAGVVSEFMSTEMFSVHPDIEIFQLADLFLSRVYRRFPVVEDGKLIGQITRRDLLRAIQDYWA
jgi:CBS domain-containing protein